MNYDSHLEGVLSKNPHMAIPWLLMASYLYYHRSISLLSDGFFDRLCATVAANWNVFEHRHKALITREDLIFGSLYRLKPEDYPTICRDAAESLARNL